MVLPRYSRRKLAARPERSLFGMAAKAVTAVLLALLAAGCDEAVEPTIAPPAAIEAPKGPALARIKWLDQHDNIAPEQWLASREAGADLTAADPAVAAMRTTLAEAAKRFSDPPRMIANRAVQLESMLAAKGITEHAPELIRSLTAAVTGVQAVEGFGTTCQHYFILRQQGLNRDAALGQLKGRAALTPPPGRAG
jgi:hypothetical protein